MTGRALRAIRARLLAADGVTLTEMMVVLAILLIVVTGMTTMFVSASNSQVDQTNRVEAQRNARLALDSLRREIRCASASPRSRRSSLTITLPGYCQKPATTTPRRSRGAPSAARRRTRSGATTAPPAPAPESRRRESLALERGLHLEPRDRRPGADADRCRDGRNARARTYVYDVTAVDAAGKETSGTHASITFATDDTNKVTISWPAHRARVLPGLRP